MTPHIPVLHTARLVMRGFTSDDLDDYVRIPADEQVYRWLGGQAPSREDAWRSLATNLGHWVLRPMELLGREQVVHRISRDVESSRG